MKYAIQINSGCCQSQAAETGYQFIKAALVQGHRILRVFFYHDGVYNGFGAAARPEDRPPASRRWSLLAEESGVDLVLCVSAVQRRGLGSAEGMQASDLDRALVPGFRIGGLGLWMEACLEADRFLVFGD
jgi:tRNA 2-thiouridine synthesizing protein D